MISCAKRDELKSPTLGRNLNECSVDPALLRILGQRILKDSAYSGYMLDSSARTVCAQRGSHTVYLIKVSKNKEDSAERTGYVGAYLNPRRNQESQTFSFFDVDMIELSDSTWDQAIRLISEPRIAIDSLDGTLMFIMKQRVANGTFYHAVVDRYYRIDPTTFALKYEFSIESISWVPVEEVYIRRLRQGTTINVYVSKNRDQRGELIGKFELNSANAWAPTNIVLEDERYEFLIETSSPRGKVIQIL